MLHRDAERLIDPSTGRIEHHHAVATHRPAPGWGATARILEAVVELAPGESRQLEKRHSMKAVTTRRYHPGAHGIALQVNGIATESLAFELLPPVE